MKDFPFDPNIFNIDILEKKYESFLKDLKAKIPKSIDEKTLDKNFEEFSISIKEMTEKFSKFYEYIKTVPLIVLLAKWIEKQIFEKNQEGSIQLLNILIRENILPIMNNNKLFLLEDLKRYSHLKIIDNIRCKDNWSFLEKENFVNSYLDFSFFLAQNSFNYITAAKDPDREKISTRLIKYETFIEFINNLPKRDSLIAKILYFGAPTIEEAISLKFSQINKKEGKIYYSSKTIDYPKYLLEELFAFSKKTQKDSLVFINIKGKEVERSHLNQSFLRASNKMSKMIKITPGMLLKHKESFAENKK
ncbi:MAG: hypothetical protein JXA94_00240 [Parachlamydiales bacterium]|nr:hypothetical protein [Parachlamydiales bacterium]